jgi:hypothetical protein
MIERCKSMRSGQMLAEKNEEGETLMQERGVVSGQEAKAEEEEVVAEDEEAAAMYSVATEEELTEEVRENVPIVRDVKMVDPVEFTIMKPLIKEMAIEDRHQDSNTMMRRVNMINGLHKDVVATLEVVHVLNNRGATTMKTVVGIKTNMMIRDNLVQEAVITVVKDPDPSQIAAVVTKTISVDNKDNHDMVKVILVEQTEEDIEPHLVMSIKVREKELLSEEDSVRAKEALSEEDSVEANAGDSVAVIEALPVMETQLDKEVVSKDIVKIINEEHHLKLYFSSI